MVKVIALVRVLYPAMLILAAAYRYGVEKHGDGTWKELTAAEHLEKAISDINAWRSGDATNKPVLVDVALRTLFALSIALTYGQTPTEYKK
jgi:hypothetical protein